MHRDDPPKKSPKQPAELLVSAGSRVREPGETSNQTLTAQALEIEVVAARKRALDAQRAAEAAISQANGAWEAGRSQPGRTPGQTNEPDRLTAAVEKAASDIAAAVGQAAQAVIQAQQQSLEKACRVLVFEMQNLARGARKPSRDDGPSGEGACNEALGREDGRSRPAPRRPKEALHDPNAQQR